MLSECAGPVELVKMTDEQRLCVRLGQSLLYELLPGASYSAYLVGSVARNRSDRVSDIDFSVFLKAKSFSKLEIQQSEQLAFAKSQNFATAIYPAGKRHIKEITIKFFPLFQVARLFKYDLVIMNYIYAHAIVLKDDIEFGKKLIAYKKAFSDRATDLAMHEIARARNALYWLSLGLERKYDRVTEAAIVLEVFERLIKTWYLIHGYPYPYRKWLFYDALKNDQLKGLAEDMCDFIADGKPINPLKVQEITAIYESFLLLADLKKFELPDTHYYSLLDW